MFPKRILTILCFTLLFTSCTQDSTALLPTLPESPQPLHASGNFLLGIEENTLGVKTTRFLVQSNDIFLTYAKAEGGPATICNNAAWENQCTQSGALLSQDHTDEQIRITQKIAARVIRREREVNATPKNAEQSLSFSLSDDAKTPLALQPFFAGGTKDVTDACFTASAGEMEERFCFSKDIMPFHQVIISNHGTPFATTRGVFAFKQANLNKQTFLEILKAL